jgi:hypothetical protein
MARPVAPAPARCRRRLPPRGEHRHGRIAGGPASTTKARIDCSTGCRSSPGDTDCVCRALLRFTIGWRAGGPDCRNQSSDPGPVTDGQSCRRKILAERAARDGYSWTVSGSTVYGPGQKPDGLFDQLIKRRRAARCSAASTGRGARASFTWTMWLRR